MRMHDKTNHGIIKGRINPHQVNKKKDLTLHSSLNHAWTLQCFSAAMLEFEGPILHQMVTPKACQSFLGSQTFLASNILLPKKDNKCQLFHSPKSSLWNIVISVCWAGIRTSRSSSFLRILRQPNFSTPKRPKNNQKELETWSPFWNAPENSFVQTLLGGFHAFPKGYSYSH